MKIFKRSLLKFDILINSHIVYSNIWSPYLVKVRMSVAILSHISGNAAGGDLRESRGTLRFCFKEKMDSFCEGSVPVIFTALLSTYILPGMPPLMQLTDYDIRYGVPLPKVALALSSFLFSEDDISKHSSMIVNVYSPLVRRHDEDTTSECHCPHQADHTSPIHRMYYKIVKGTPERHLSTASQYAGYVYSCLPKH